MTLPTQPGLYEYEDYPLSKGYFPYLLREDGQWCSTNGDMTDPYPIGDVKSVERTFPKKFTFIEAVPVESDVETVTPNPYKDLLAEAVMELEEWIRGERSNWNELHGSVTGDYDNQIVNTALADAAQKNALAAKVNALTALYTKES